MSSVVYCKEDVYYEETKRYIKQNNNYKIWYYTLNFGTVGQPEIRKTAIFRHRQSFIH